MCCFLWWGGVHIRKSEDIDNGGTNDSPKIPKIDSIQELAHFWDTHDLTDFKSELEEVNESVFEFPTELLIPLEPEELEGLNALAKSRDISAANLIRDWVLEHIETPQELTT